MHAHDEPFVAEAADVQVMRREHDRITVIDARLRAVLLGSRRDGMSAPPASFMESLKGAIAQLAFAMQESLVEVWLRDLPPWATGPYHEDDPPLRVYASMTAQPSDDRERLRRPVDDIVLSVITAGRPMRFDFDDIATHPQVSAWVIRAGVNPETVVTFLGMPIAARGEVFGVLALAFAEDPSPEHVLLIDSLAEYIAVAAQHAYLYYRLNAQDDLSQNVIRELPLAVAVLSPPDYILTLTNSLFDHLLQVDQRAWGQRLDVLVPDHAAQLRAAWQLDEVAQTGEPRMMYDVSIRLPEGLTYWDFTVSPLVVSESLEGVMVAGFNVTARVVQRQRQKRSVDIAQERVSQMVALHQIALDVASQLGQDPRELLRQIVERMATLVGATGGMVYYADRESGDLEVVVSSGLRRDYISTRLDRGAGLAGRVVITGESQHVDDYRSYPLRATVFADEPFGAVAAIPMKQRGQVIGVICLIHERVGGRPSGPITAPDETARTSFTSDDMWLLELFATQAAHAIENARTYLDLERSYQQQRALDRQKDDFIARASHDLRLPLTSVIGFLDLAVEMVHDGNQTETLPILQQGVEEAQRLRELMDHLLAQVRLESGARELHANAMHLIPIVEDVVGARRKQAAIHGVRYSFVVEIPEDLVIIADIARLKEVIENLLSNAVKYSPQGGEVRVETQVAEIAYPGMALIRVLDQGIGIPSEAHDQIFERFARVDTPLAREIQGNGFGLYLARQLVESMGGKLWLESSVPGEGSVFALTLPLASS